MFIIGFNYWCLLVQLAIGAQEMIQLRSQGMEYFESVFNIAELIGLFLQLIYCILRIQSPTKAIPDTEAAKDIRDIHYSQIELAMPFLNVAIIILISFKALSFLRSYNELAVVVQLLGQCIKEIFFFLMFVISWVLIFSQVNILLGADYHAEQPSQEELGFFLRVLVQTWKNAIGDAGPPSFVQWEQLISIHYLDDIFWP